MSGFINWPNRGDKNSAADTGQKMFMDKQYIDYLDKYQETIFKLREENKSLIEQVGYIRQDMYRLQSENEAFRRQQSFVQSEREALKKQQLLLQSEKEELKKQQSFVQQERSKFEKEKEKYREQAIKEQGLRKQAEFRLEVAERELREEIKKQSTREEKPQDLQRRKQSHELTEGGKENESKKQIQKELAECSKAIRKMQQMIKETYQFEPCQQLCELLVNIRQKVYTETESIQEDLGCIIETFGIKEYKAEPGDDFDAKYHEQVYGNLLDVKGKKIKQVFSSGFEMSGEIIMKAQVSIEEPETGGVHV